MKSPAAVLGLATAVPPHRLDQGDVAQFARRVYARSFARYPKLADVYRNAGIAHRYSVRPLDWFTRPHDWRERTQAYLDGADALFIAAATKALKRAKLRARDIDVIVTVSSTGIATPSLEARVGERLGFRADATRVPVFGLGCAGGVSGLSIASRMARAVPGENVLLVVVELCTLAFRGDRGAKADVISSALFGDGAAAIVLRAGETGKDVLQVGATGEYTWPGTLDIMGWSIDPTGFGVILSRSLPKFVEQKFAAPARRFVKEAKLGTPHYICHPGGAKVLDAVEGALGLDEGDCADERRVLHDFGNMSAPTVLFVLERAMKRRLPNAVLAALGPGFTASFLALGAAHA
ncbi:MAG: type III polyketide synthase [Pseudolabrys sp.]|nr:type III polyketide synthase [Pseudolabrys sp.]